VKYSDYDPDGAKHLTPAELAMNAMELAGSTAHPDPAKVEQAFNYVNRTLHPHDHASVLAAEVVALRADLAARARLADSYREDRDEYDALLGRKLAERDAALDREAGTSDALDEMRADRDRLARRVAELEADLQSIRLWWKRKPWEGNPDPGSFGGHPYSPNERALGYGTISDPRFLPPALAGDGGGA